MSPGLVKVGDSLGIPTACLTPAHSARLRDEVPLAVVWAVLRPALAPRSDRLVTDEPNLRQSQEAPRVFLAVRGTGLALAGAAPVVAAATPAPRRVRVSVRFMPNIQLTNFTSAHSGMSRRRARLRGVAAGRRGEGDRTDRVRAARRPLLDLRVVRPQPTRLPVFVNSIICRLL